ncbi:7-methylguanosine phosphate-specific 5'-nucleotidase A-like [Oscarella lobularis]|uniref:7-methylguanosine phosphate-specific 5'-nucleotidase A-like n=1 Tax=Oscarella lobularis TaxID=121494 RepID=UPI003313F09F
MTGISYRSAAAVAAIAVGLAVGIYAYYRIKAKRTEFWPRRGAAPPQQALSEWHGIESDDVRVVDPEKLAEKLKKMAERGSEGLQVISDFDMTLSKMWQNGERALTSHGVIEQTSRLPPEFREKVLALKQHYYPIETSPSIPREEKIHHMEQWWGSAHDAFVNCRLHRDVIPQIVAETKLNLRDGCTHLFELLHRHNVPLLVFSAGLGDIIREILRQRSVFYPNMHIVSNFMEFDDQGVISGFKGNLIHTFNKNENSVHNSDYFEEIEARNNVVLIGDSEGDPHMADGIENIENIIKIGFLNDKVEERLPKHLSLYDIVLTGDGDMSVVNTILRYILQV